MESTAPAKSQPLHNFDLPNLKWNTDGNSSSNHNHLRRSIKSPARRPHASSASSICHSPLRDSVSAPPPPPPRLQSPLRDSAALSSHESPARGNFMVKQSPIREESSKPSPIRECYLKHSLTNGDPERLSSIREEALRKFRSGHSSPEAGASRKSKGAPILYRGNHSRNSASGSMRICSSGTEKAKEKIEKKSKVTEVDVAGIKRSKIVIKIPSKNNKPDEENSQDELRKIVNNGEHGGIEEVQEEGKLIDNNVDEEMRIWNLRPRKPKGKTKKATVGVEKGNASGNPVKTKKAQSPLKNTNKSGEKEPNCGSGGEKKEKKEKRKLSICISLSKAEIEEDIYALSGSKPSRRPKKRAKNIQKKVDSVFPGLWLVSISPDSYKVSENYLKG